MRAFAAMSPEPCQGNGGYAGDERRGLKDGGQESRQAALDGADIRRQPR